MATADVVPLWRLRAVARAPRFALVSAGLVLSVVGIKSLATSPARTAIPIDRPNRSIDPAAEGMAQDFVRNYFARKPMPDGMTLDGSGVPVRVRWTAITGDEAIGRGRRVVTVAVDFGTGTNYMAVTIERDQHGRLFVTGPPAIVGPPAVASGQLSRPELEVEETDIRAVAARVVRHYLGRNRQDLAADLLPRAVVSLPSRPLRIVSIDAITWASPPRRVAVALVARGAGGLRLSLRYELVVVRLQGRWLVRTIHVDPISQEGAS